MNNQINQPTTYIVSFYTHTEEVRLKVCEVLKSYGVYCPIHNYCWAIVSFTNAVEIRDKIKTVINSADSVFVIRSGISAAWYNSYGEANNNWLKEKL